MATIFVTSAKPYFVPQEKGEENKYQTKEGGVPVVDQEVWPQATHVATDAKVLEYLAGKAAIGVLIVGGIANVADDDKQHRDVVKEYLSETVVVFVPSEFKRQEIGSKIGEHQASDGGNAEDKIAPYYAQPFGRAFDVEYPGVRQVEECLCCPKQQERQQGFAEEVGIYVAGVNPTFFSWGYHLGL